MDITKEEKYEEFFKRLFFSGKCCDEYTMKLLNVKSNIMGIKYDRSIEIISRLLEKYKSYVEFYETYYGMDEFYSKEKSSELIEVIKELGLSDHEIISLNRIINHKVRYTKNSEIIKLGNTYNDIFSIDKSEYIDRKINELFKRALSIKNRKVSIKGSILDKDLKSFFYTFNKTNDFDGSNEAVITLYKHKKILNYFHGIAVCKSGVYITMTRNNVYIPFAVMSREPDLELFFGIKIKVYNERECIEIELKDEENATVLYGVIKLLYENRNEIF